MLVIKKICHADSVFSGIYLIATQKKSEKFDENSFLLKQLFIYK